MIVQVRWLSSKNFRPSEIYKEVSKYIEQDAPCLLVYDDSVLSKQYSKKIELVNYQYSGAVHDVIAGIGMVNLLHLFKFVAKNGRIDYITTNIKNPTREQIEKIIKARWSIEVYHRELKQTCGIERCQACTGRAQRNHICLAVFAWLEMNKRGMYEKITLYQQTWEYIKTSIQDNIRWLLNDTHFS